jgi:TonB family protein
MSAPRVAVAASLLLHAALVLLLALAAAPWSLVTDDLPEHVVLRLTPAQPEPGGTDAPEAAPARPGPGSSSRTVRSESADDAVVPALDAKPADRGGTSTHVPLPKDLMASPQPLPLPLAERPVPPAPAQPLPATMPRMEPRETLPAPDLHPSPADLLSELSSAGSGAPRGARASGTGIPTTSVIPAGSYGSRSPLSQPLPAFPESFRREGREAEVGARIWIDPTGAVVRVELTRSSGDTAVDNAVERALRGYLFAPADGVSIDVGVVTFHFRLEKGF